MCLGMFMAVLDIQIVASSLPDIQTAFGIPLDLLGWVQTAYLIAEIIAIPLTARLTRLLSLRGLFVVAISGFTLASLGAALSPNFDLLLLFRVIQGFCGGAIIPAVFTAGFALFPPDRRVLPTTIAGIFAMVAPTLGPVVGGYITDTYSWHWMFLINLPPGLLVAVLTGALLRGARPDWPFLRQLDYAGAALAALFLGSFVLFLKEAPKHHWTGGYISMLAFVCVASGIGAVHRCLTHAEPIVELALFRQRAFAASCLFSFTLGAGLYGSVYLTPVFLGLVRDHTPIEIGLVMIVSGAAQLLAAPVAAVAEKRMNLLLLAGIGYGLFGIGLVANAFETVDTDFAGFFWPQVLRGAGVMLCILPSMTIALEHRLGDDLANASAIFNLMRNLGGTIAIALVDTVLQQRTPIHVARLIARLQAGDPDAARIVGLPLDRFHNVPLRPDRRGDQGAGGPHGPACRPRPHHQRGLAAAGPPLRPDLAGAAAACGAAEAYSAIAGIGLSGLRPMPSTITAASRQKAPEIMKASM